MFIFCCCLEMSLMDINFIIIIIIREDPWGDRLYHSATEGELTNQSA